MSKSARRFAIRKGKEEERRVGTCATKKRFRSIDEAKEALISIKYARKSHPMNEYSVKRREVRYYYCACRGYPLTSKPNY